MARAFQFTGDFRELERWAKQVEQAGKTKILVELNKVLAEEVIDLVAEGFSRQTDPYGKRWKGKAIPDGRAVLTGRTSRLRNGWKRSRLSAAGFTITPSVRYAGYHQTGTGIHGPSGQPIRPKRAKALSFKAGGNRKSKAGKFFARSVKGAPARKMVPDDGALPARWRSRLIAASTEFMRGRFGG